MTKPTHTCASCGPLAPDLVIRDHKRPRCALCGAEATPTVRALRLVAKPAPPDYIRRYGPVPPGIVSSRTWTPDGTVYSAGRLARAMGRE